MAGKIAHSGRTGQFSRALWQALLIPMLLTLAACTSVAPGIQFSKARPYSSQVNAEEQIKSEIRPITPKLVRMEREAREHEVTENISALMQHATAYTIAPGDVLQIVVWDHPELSASMVPAAPAGALGAAGAAASPMAQPQSGFEIDQDGFLEFPYAGKLQVAGLTPEQIHARLTKKLAFYLKNPKVTLRVLSYRSKRVYLDGEVKSPGVQAINDIPMTLLEAINRAGGMLPTADQSRIAITRDGKTYQINLPLLVQRGVNPGTILLTNGDVVRVLSRDESKIFISGEVTSPRALTMRNGRLTLNEALGESGGINPVSGDARQVYVVRRDSSASVVYQLDANAPGALAMAEGFELNPKDVVYVAPTSLTNWNRTISALIPGALPTAVIATTPGK
jgi:polysaccharide export outer membrane protein